MKNYFNVLIALLVTLSLPVKAESFYYDGKGITAATSLQQMKDHVCLSLTVFLESRGEDESSQMFHGMAIIKRALNRNRFSNTVCGVVTEKSQYEPIKQKEKDAIEKFLLGDLSAIDTYIEDNFNAMKDLDRWYRVNRITYDLITAKDTEGWSDADHFYSPKSLLQRGMSTPAWISEYQVTMVSGDTVFLNK